jgi:hypothetical protein
MVAYTGVIQTTAYRHRIARMNLIGKLVRGILLGTDGLKDDPA